MTAQSDSIQYEPYELSIANMSHQLVHLRAQQMNMIETKASADCHNNFNQSTAKSKKLQAKIILLQLLQKYKDPRKAMIRHGFAVFRQNAGTLSVKERLILH